MPLIAPSLQTTDAHSVVLAVAIAAARSMADSNKREREQRRVARQLESANEQFRAGMELAVELKNRLEDKMMYQFMVRGELYFFSMLLKMYIHDTAVRFMMATVTVMVMVRVLERHHRRHHCHRRLCG